MSAACEHVREKMAAYVDREIDGADCARITAHLEQCSACAEAVAAQRRVKEILRARARRLPAPFYLRARIRRSLDRGGDFGAAMEKIFAFHPLRAWAALAGVVAAAVLMTLLAGRLWTRFSDPIAYHAGAVIVGRIVCADCALMQKTRTAAPHLSSHHLVIQTQEGRIWTIVLSPAGQELLQRTDVATQRVQAKGYLFPGVSYIQVTDFSISQN